MIERKAEQFIKKFLIEDNRALLVSGARQVGKTFLIRKVCKELFENVVEINFIEQPDAVSLLDKATDVKNIFLRLSAIADKPLTPGKTIIFFDEVQKCPEIVTAIKFLVDDGRFKYVLSGSTLGVELQDIRSVPVGYMYEYIMYPLDMQEFFKAIGINDNVVNELKNCFLNRVSVDEFIHKRMLGVVNLYLLVGGMPAVVQRYLDTNNIKSVYEEQIGILNMYKKDISQYDFENKLQIEDIFELIPSELNSKNKRFIIKNLNEKARFSKYESSFLWLKNAAVAIPTFDVDEPKMPLELSKQRNLFKLFLSDVGLLAAMYGGNIQTAVLSNAPSINYGSIYENLVAQELCAHGFSKDKHFLYYYNNKKIGEVDFIVEYDNRVVPVEVKSGKDYERHIALNNLLDIKDFDINEAYVFCSSNLFVKDKVVYYPIYMIAFFEQVQVEDKVFKLDLSGLK